MSDGMSPRTIKIVRVHHLYNARYEVRFHFPLGYQTDRKKLEQVVRAFDEAHAWNVDEVDKIECLPEVFPYRYADVGEVIERRVVVTPADAPMPVGKLDGYRNHVDQVRNHMDNWAKGALPELLALHINCQF